jgi:hypothetical protein
MLERRGDHGFRVRSPEGGNRFVVDAGELHAMAIGPEGSIWVAGEGRLYRVAPPGEISLNVVDWRIELDEAGPGVHTVHMRVDVFGLSPDQVGSTSGTLAWDDTIVDLCAIGIDFGGGVFEVGDIFETTEGCGSNPNAMQDAFDAYGTPAQACVHIQADDGILHSICEPLSIDGAPSP